MKKIFSYLTILMLLSGCEKFIEVEPPRNSIIDANAYTSDKSAISVLNGMYTTLVQGTVVSGNLAMPLIAGLSSDELYVEVDNDVPYRYYVNALQSSTTSIWPGFFKVLYIANALIENVEGNTAISQGASNQIIGEALFMRAFCNFHLVNCFGATPLVTSTDYMTNNKLHRKSTDAIYAVILEDLKRSRELIGEGYPTSERVRPNKAAVTALLARVYLYTKNYAAAEEESTKIIANTQLYETLPLDQVFLKNNREAIWQLAPVVDQYVNTSNWLAVVDGGTLGSTMPLRDAFADSFELGDNRVNAWTGSATVDGKVFRFASKYKETAFTATGSEYEVVLRLSEQYLVRAEARIMQAGKEGLGIEDINVVRTRAGLLPLALNLSKNDAFDALMTERKHELFTEWGHRWFDLKRTDLANSIMPAVSTQKGGTWQPYDQLYPVPETELLNNPNLAPQNTGY